MNEWIKWWMDVTKSTCITRPHTQPPTHLPSLLLSHLDPANCNGWADAHRNQIAITFT
jgi:hypothetical protein